MNWLEASQSFWHKSRVLRHCALKTTHNFSPNATVTWPASEEKMANNECTFQSTTTWDYIAWSENRVDVWTQHTRKSGLKLRELFVGLAPTLVPDSMLHHHNNYFTPQNRRLSIWHFRRRFCGFWPDSRADFGRSFVEKWELFFLFFFSFAKLCATFREKSGLFWTWILFGLVR